MVAKGGGRRGSSNNNNNRTKDNARRRRRQSDSSDDNDDDDDDDNDDEEHEEEGPPPKFVLTGDDTGSGIDYNVLEEESWQTLEEYCKKWGIKQGHLESIYSRFARTIERTEHLDFTPKPQFHASLDFLADEFMTTAGEFAAQIFIQTWFLRRKRGLQPPKDRRCVDFTRLVVMCCDLARLGDYELLANLWTCVLHRFGGMLPKGTVNLDTRLNTELVKEVITVLHTSLDKKLNLLIDKLLLESEELTDSQAAAKSTGSSVSSSSKEMEGGVLQDDEEAEGSSGKQPKRYLTLRTVLRFSFQHPPLLFPVVHFQRVLRSKIIGSRYWLRRRKPARERGLNLRSSLGLPNAYHDLFDRIESCAHAWIIASGHLLLHALDPPPPHTAAAAAAAAAAASGSAKSCDKIKGGGRRGGRREGDDCGGEEHDGVEHGDLYYERYQRLLDNCLQPSWYKVAEKPAASTVIGEVGGKMIPSLTVALTQFAASAKSALSPKSSPTSSPVRSPTPTSATKTKEEQDTVAVAAAAAAQQQPDDSSSLAVAQKKLRTPRKSRARSRSSTVGRSERSRSRSGRSRSRTPTTTTPAAAGAAAVPAVPAPAPAPDTKTCAICLRKTSPVALCRKCGRRAAKALKDAQGSRQARVILIPYGAFFGVGEPDALQAEGDAVKRWVRLFDDETGADFYHNVHFDSSVWKSGIELPKPLPGVKVVRRRKGGGGGGGVGGTLVVGSPKSDSAAPENKSTNPPGGPAVPLSTNEAGGAKSPRGMTFRVAALAAAAAVSSAAASGSSTGRTALRKTKTAFSAASMAALQAVAGGSSASISGPIDSGGSAPASAATSRPTIYNKPAIKKTASPAPKTVSSTTPSTAAAAAFPGCRPVVISAGDTAAPEVVLDAQKRIYPPFRLISWEDAEGAAATAAAAAAGGIVEGVVTTPGRGLGFSRKSPSRGGGSAPLGESAGSGRPRLTMTAAAAGAP